MIINGKKIAQKILDDLEKEIKNIDKPLRLAAVLVGDSEDLMKFLELKQKAAAGIGIDFRIYKFPENISSNKLREELNKIVKLKKNDGVIIELPLPRHLNTQYLLNVIPEEKDVDVLSQKSQGSFFVNRSKVLPPSVEAVKQIFDEYQIDLKGKHAIIFGYGLLVGKPISHWLLNQGATVSIINEFAKSPERISKQADIIISGVGKPELIKKDMVKEKAIVIDFGYNKEGVKILGDVDFQKIVDKVSLITPVPGGVGPIVVASVLRNLVVLAEKK